MIPMEVVVQLDDDDDNDDYNVFSSYQRASNSWYQGEPINYDDDDKIDDNDDDDVDDDDDDNDGNGVFQIPIKYIMKMKMWAVIIFFPKKKWV